MSNTAIQDNTIANNIAKENKPKIYFKTEKKDRSIETIFNLKKLKRNGLLEKKIIKKQGFINVGRWMRDEHNRFIKACLEYGAKWKKIQQDVKTRTTAQIRSHAQKYIIKLCKRYDIEIKSRRRIKFASEHLNFPYRRKTKSSPLPIENMSNHDKKFIKNFNFYEKKIDFEKIEKTLLSKKKIIFKVKRQDEKNENKLSFINTSLVTKLECVKPIVSDLESDLINVIDEFKSKDSNCNNRYIKCDDINKNTYLNSFNDNCIVNISTELDSFNKSNLSNLLLKYVHINNLILNDLSLPINYGVSNTEILLKYLILCMKK